MPFPCAPPADPAPRESDQGNVPAYTSLPTDVAALQSMIYSLQAELRAITSLSPHLAAFVAGFRPQEAIPTPTTTTTPIITPATTVINTAINTPITITTTITAAPVDSAATNAITTASCPRSSRTLSAPSGRGAASPAIFNKMIMTNRTGNLGRTHMAAVDALPITALNELDCFLRRTLRDLFPRGATYKTPNVNEIFASLAALGLGLDDRDRYVDFPLMDDSTMHLDSTAKRATNITGHFYSNFGSGYVNYWSALVLETLIELARYRGVFDDEGFVTVV